MGALFIFFYLYLAIGFLMAVFLMFNKQLEKKDPSFRATGIGVKLLIIPGLLIFWPMLVYRLYLKKHS